MSEREKMLRKVMEYEFSVIDAGLYLDSYPDCECAVDYFLKTRAMRNNAVSDYERKFGALTIYGDNITDRYTVAVGNGGLLVCGFMKKSLNFR